MDIDSLNTVSESEQSLINHLNQAMLVVNTDLTVVLCNEATSHFWKSPQNKIIRQKVKKLFMGDEILMKHIEQVFREQKNVHLMEYPFYHIAWKQKRITEITMNPVLEGEEGIQYAVIAISDKTHMVATKAKEREKAILDSIGLFMSSIAHEIQNPLSGIKGVTQLLQRDLEKQQMPTESTLMILNELGRIERLLKQLSMYSQPVEIDPTSFNMHELLNTVLWFEESVAKNTIQFKREFDPSLPDLQADRDKLHQVFLNLIRNAVEASPAHGAITVRTRYCRQWEIVEKTLDPTQRYYLVEIQDEGPGIAPEHIDQLFTPLFTTKTKGKGLGLSVSFRIVHSHGGLLKYQEMEQGGALFQIYLPSLSLQVTEQ